MGNAIKFTSEGEVKLKLRQISQGIRIEVTDTGMGISEEQIKTVFESFTQGSQGINRRFGGTGLGLTISQRFVQGMGGKIGVESQVGKGSTFWFELSLERSELQAVPEVNKVELNDFSGWKVLVVDDEIVNRVVVLSFRYSKILANRKIKFPSNSLFFGQVIWKIFVVDFICRYY